jgi:THO complex subunit 5
MATDFADIIHDSDLVHVLTCIHSIRSTSLDLLDLQASKSPSQSPPSSPSPSDVELARLQSKLFAHAAQLKSLHRKAIMSVRETKQLTSDARSEVDRLNLQLQNLVYEQRHLRGEISACEDYE